MDKHEKTQTTALNDGADAALDWLYNEHAESAYRVPTEPPRCDSNGLRQTGRESRPSTDDVSRRRRRLVAVASITAAVVVAGVAMIGLLPRTHEPAVVSSVDALARQHVSDDDSRARANTAPVVTDAAIALNDRTDSVVVKFVAESSNVDTADFALVDANGDPVTSLTLPAADDGLLSAGVKLTVEDALKVTGVSLTSGDADLLTDSVRLRLERTLRADVDTVRTRIAEEQKMSQDAIDEIERAASASEVESHEQTDTSSQPQANRDRQRDSGESSQSASQSHDAEQHDTAEADRSRRVSALDAYLQGTPLAPVSEKLVDDAVSRGVDWRLLPAIARVQTELGVFTDHRNDAWGLGVDYASVEDATNAAFAALGSTREADASLVVVFGADDDPDEWLDAVHAELDALDHQG